MLVVHHVVKEASLHYSALDLLLRDCFYLAAPIDPVALDDISEKQKGGELKLSMGGLGIDGEEGKGELRLFFTFVEIGVGNVDLLRSGSGDMDSGECLCNMADIDCCLHNIIRVITWQNMTGWQSSAREWLVSHWRCRQEVDVSPPGRQLEQVARLRTDD